MGVCAVFGINFRQKRASRSSCLVLGSLEPRPVWVEMGVCLNVPSRLKGMETCFRSNSALDSKGSECAFPFEGNGNLELRDGCKIVYGLNVPSRLKGMETGSSVLGLSVAGSV